MRDLLVSLLVLGSLPLAFKKPLVGLLMFSMLAYMRLQDLSWGFAKDERWSMYVAVTMLAGWLVAREKHLPVLEPRTLLLGFLVFWIGLGQGFAVGAKPVSFAAYIEYVKIVFIALFTTQVVRTREHLRILVWVIALSFGFYAIKNGIPGVLSLGTTYIKRGPGGMIEDNNDFALVMAMAVPLLLHLAKSERNQLLSKWLTVMAPLAGLVVILTRSRGGALSLAMAGAILVWRSKNRMLGVMVGACAAVAVLAVAPAEWKERIQTISTYEEDGSAMGRIRAWMVAGRMIQEHPMTGVGFDRFITNHLAFEPNPHPEQLSGSGGLVAHNSYLQIWAECGTPAFAAYLLLLALSFIDIWRVRKEAKRRYNESWILNYCTMFEAALLTFMTGSMFLNRAHFDLVYHLFTIILVFGRVAREQIKQDDAGVGQTFSNSYGRGRLVALEGRGFRRMAHRARGFRRTNLS